MMDTSKRNARSLVLATLLIILGLLVITNISPSHADSIHNNADFSAVDAYVEAQMKTLKIPGLALAIVQGDQVIYAKGYGQAHPDGIPVTSQTPFMIGSTTKSITALAVMQLVESGKIELDAPVQTYIPSARRGSFRSTPVGLTPPRRPTVGLPLPALRPIVCRDGGMDLHIRALYPIPLSREYHYARLNDSDNLSVIHL